MVTALRWMIFPGVCLALVGLAGAAPPDSPRIVRGAEVIGPFSVQRRDIDLRTLPAAPAWQPGMPIKEIPKRNNHQGKLEPPAPAANPVTWTLDPLVELQAKVQARMGKSFDVRLIDVGGQGFTGVQPPDTVGDVGTDYYIQMVNAGGGSQFTVYDKADGSIAVGPLSLDSLAGSPGLCTTGAGDPIVLYDQLAGRWLLAEFSSTGNRLCVYVSQTGDPIAGGWYAYEFDDPPSFPDYPKFGVWPDAYYASSNESSPAVYAFDRAAMLNGQAATGQRFTASSLGAFGFQALTPGDHDGPMAPPGGAPGYFMRHRDDEAHNPAGNDPSQDFLELYEFSVDFDVPGNSTFSGPAQIPITEIDSELCGFTSFECFPQPDGGDALDPLREVVMWRLVYRNSGTHETLIGSLVTDVDGTDHGGVRWFELRRSGAGPWALFQEGTYAPDADHRWMSSIAMDAKGNLALGYSIVSTATYAGIRYAGRLAGDPLGTLPRGEHLIIDGLGAHSGNRWGDYSSMNLDPVDDCTFWYTNEYGLASGAWGTRIAAFRFDGCLDPDFTLGADPLAQGICAPGDLGPLTVDVGQVSSFTDPVTLSLENLPAGFSSAAGFSVNPVTPPGASSVTVSVDNTVVPGPYGFGVRGSAPGVTDKTVNVAVDVFDTVPTVPALQSPADGATDVMLAPTFTWTPVSQGSSYTLEVDDDPAFASIDYSAQVADTAHAAAQLLQPGTEYFWRVRSENPCGGGGYSAVFSFTTVDALCAAPALPIPDGDIAGVNDELIVGAGSFITDLDVLIQADHTWVGDLIFQLTHVETATSIFLINRPGVPGSTFGCSGDDIDVTLDDGAPTPVEDECALTPPALNGRFQPNGNLALFNGELLTGTWRLNVSDRALPDAGVLTQWCLFPQTTNLADLAISKDDGLIEVGLGDSVTYTLVVGNAGPGDVSGALVEDGFGGSLSNVTWTCAGTGGATCAAAGAGDISENVDIPAAQSVTFQVTGDVITPDVSLTNTATVTPPADTQDPDASNNSATDVDVVTLLIDGFEGT